VEGDMITLRNILYRAIVCIRIILKYHTNTKILENKDIEVMSIWGLISFNAT
jgi:hypothetical protein